MFKSLVVFAFIISTAQASIANNRRFECPFRDFQGKICIRSTAFIEFLKEHPEERNSRPDVLIMPTTKQYERVSNDVCCYEEKCLRDCKVFESVIDNQLSNEVSFFAQFFVEYDSIFFKNVDKTELRKLRNPIVFPKLIVQWKIKMAHYYKETSKE